jgi:hypothetical protein
VTVSVNFRRAPVSAALVTRVALVLLAVALGASACASSSATPRAASAATPGFVFARDTFAFRNEIRARHPDRDDLYAN